MGISIEVIIIGDMSWWSLELYINHVSIDNIDVVYI